MATYPPNPPKGGNPPPLYHESDLENYIPSNVELVAAHIYARHGERTPVKTRFESLIPERWAQCAATATVKVPTLNPSLTTKSTPSSLSTKDPALSDIPVHALQQIPQGNNNTRSTEENECSLGQLTDLGRTSAFRLGDSIRKLYIEKLGLVPATLDTLSSENHSFRATYIPRAIQTLHQIIAGLYPAPHLGTTPTLLIREPWHESLFPNNTCRLLRKLDNDVAEEAAKKYNPSLEQYDSLAKSTLGTTLRINGHPRASGILDSIRAASAHGYSTPKQFSDDQKVMQDLETAVVHEWFDGFVSAQHARLSSGLLFGDLLKSFRETPRMPQESAKAITTTTRSSSSSPETKPPIRLAVYACHDTSLGGILSSLGVFDQRWPPFTSHVTFELFKAKQKQHDNTSSSSPQQTSSGILESVKNIFSSSPSLSSPGDNVPSFVRVRYNGKTMKLPACKDAQNHLQGSEGSICTLEAFQTVVKNIETTYPEWVKECNQQQ